MRTDSMRTGEWLPAMFNDIFDVCLPTKKHSTSPAINVMETEKGYQVELAAPGAKKEDLQMTRGNSPSAQLRPQSRTRML